MANSRIYFKNEAGGTTVVSRDTTSTSGNLVLPASGNVVSVDTAVTDNAIARYNGTTGKLQNSSVVIDDNGNIGSGTQSFNGFGGSGFKNHIINGNFDIWQRGTSQTTSGYGSDDRWHNSNLGSAKNHSQVACTDTEKVNFNARFYTKTIVTSVAGAGNYVSKSQVIEDVTRLAGKTVTLSFWANADSNRNIAVEFAQVFGTGGSPSSVVSGIGSQTIPLTTLWKKYTITVTLPSIVGKTIGTDGVHTSSTFMSFWFDAGSNFNSRAANLGQQSGTFDIAQVQLEEGSIATPFENRPYALELSLCQRYYETIQVNNLFYGVAGMNWQLSVPYNVAKRVNPSVVVATPTGHINIGTITTTGNNTTVSVAQGTVVANGQVSVNTVLTASAEL